MKRREAFKKIGILALVGGGSISLLSACKNIVEETSPVAGADTETQKEEAPINGWSEDRNKLIVNRTKQQIADPDNPTKAELKHSPDITFGEQDGQGHTLIKVTVGKDGIIHPSTKEHWIDYLTLYVNDVQYAHIEYVNGNIRAYDNFYASLTTGDVIKVESGCNIHGIWTSEVVFE